MSFINEYRYIVIPVGTWFFIQLFKVISDFVRTKKFNIKRIIGAGGMPSSHSAVATSLATLIGRYQGFNSALFGLATIFACVVMYDATGVRRAAGEQAKLLNQIVETPGLTEIKEKEKLVEVLGHTPVQVIVGVTIGIIVGFIC